ncbi:MAG: helix-turn-helix transcriptional regulator [Mollicutes bacterium]|nr:helix-turn-helix transcriptional regulator [Mollicutes bacterium]
MKTLETKRKEFNYSYKNMADMLKISKTYYWQLENKKRRMSYEMAVKIADIFNLKPDDLFYNEFKSKD